MRLLEFEGKELLRRYGIPVPAGFFLGQKEDPHPFPASWTFPCLVKAQTLGGGRGKEGLIRHVHSYTEALATTAEFLAKKGEHGIWIEERLMIRKEFFVAVTLDRRQSLPVLMLSAQGGVEVEKAGAEALIRVPFEGGAHWSFHRFIDLLIPLGL